MQYPTCWNLLGQAPSARFELISYIDDVLDWNAPDSHLRSAGTDSLIGFLFDDYRLDEGARRLVVELIFEDEQRYLDQFISCFRRFLDESEEDVRDLHEIALPDDVLASARALRGKLLERGVPR